jgi:Restriction endonuclease/Sigma-70, region 4
MNRPIGDRLSELHEATVEDITSALKTLGFREREIFKLRTGFPLGYCYTNAEVGHIFRISASRVSQIHARGRRKFLQRIAQYIPESEVDISTVRSVIASATELTPYLISHLKTNPEDLRLLDWRVFEHLVAEFFTEMGYADVRLVGRSGKTGADVFALTKIEPDGTELRIFIETKRWRDNVGVEVVDRVYGAFLGEKSTFGWHMAMIVTVGRFTDIEKYSRDQLKMMGISLKDGDDVKRWLNAYKFKKSGLWLPDPKIGIIE